jgi:hypothetical protein
VSLPYVRLALDHAIDAHNEAAARVADYRRDVARAEDDAKAAACLHAFN